MVELLEKSTEALDPIQIHGRLREQGVRVDRASVYRVLTVLEDHRLVHKLVTSGGYMACHPPTHLHLNTEGEPKDSSCHHHLVCRSCRTVREIHCDGLKDLVDSIGRATGFTVERHVVELSGLCRECQIENARRVP